LHGRLDNIDLALKENDWNEINNIVHSLKGIGTSLGFPEITKYADIINLKTINKQYQDIENDIANLRNIGNKLIKKNLH